jgi:hypothetical protein
MSIPIEDAILESKVLLNRFNLYGLSEGLDTKLERAANSTHNHPQNVAVIPIATLFVTSRNLDSGLREPAGHSFIGIGIKHRLNRLGKLWLVL